MGSQTRIPPARVGALRPGDPRRVGGYRLTGLNLVTSAAVPRAPRALGAVAVSPDGGTLAVSGDAGLSLLDAMTLRTIRSVAAPPGASGGPVYRPDGKVLAAGGASVTAAAAAGFTPDGAVLAGYSVASGAVAWLLQASTLAIIASTPLGPAADLTNLAVDLSTDGETLIVAYTSKRARAGRIQLYRIEPG